MRKFILWDHDGVLVDTERRYIEATRQALSGFGVALDDATYFEIASRGASYFDLAAARGVTAEAIAAARAERDRVYLELLAREPVEIPHAAAVLGQLARAYRMAIVTTSRRSYIDAIHGERRITRFMEFVITVDDCPRHKPLPDPYLMALDRFDAQASDAVVVEDSPQGLAAARAAGIDCVVIRNPFAPAGDFAGAALVVDDIREVPAAIARVDRRDSG